MSTENGDRLALRMGPDTKRKIDQWYEAAGCHSRNQFVEQAVNFYADHLALQDNDSLPRAVNYVKYIGTRERVELVPDERHATKKQEQLITDLLKDFPDAQKLPEYGNYCNAPTKVNASVFITQALEDNWDGVQQSDIYLPGQCLAQGWHPQSAYRSQTASADTGEKDCHGPQAGWP